MITLHYTFDGEPFDYEVDADRVQQVIYNWIIDNWSHDDTVDYILSSDGCVVNLFEDFKEEILYEFEEEAKDFYEECKNSDNGVDQGDFL